MIFSHSFLYLPLVLLFFSSPPWVPRLVSSWLPTIWALDPPCTHFFYSRVSFMHYSIISFRIVYSHHSSLFPLHGITIHHVLESPHPGFINQYVLFT